MVKFDSKSVFQHEQGNYFYTFQKGDTVYAVAEKIAKENGGDVRKICEDLIRQSNLTTNPNDASKSKTHVNKIPVGYQINLGQGYGEYFSKFVSADSPAATQRQARRFADNGVSYRESFSDIEDTLVQTHEELQNKECADVPPPPEPYPHPAAVTNNKTARPTSDTVKKREYSLAEVMALQGGETRAASSPKASDQVTLGSEFSGIVIEEEASHGDLAAQASGKGLLGIASQEKTQRQVAALTGTASPNPENTAVTENEDEEWTDEGSLEPKLSRADLETLRQLREARAEDDPIDYDPATGLDMSAYTNAYTDSERSSIRENLKYSLQELRAAENLEGLGKFDSKKFAALRFNTMFVLIPFGLSEQEANQLADYLFRFHRTSTLETRRAFHALTTAQARREESLRGIMEEALPEDNSAVADEAGKKAPFEISDEEWDELFDADKKDHGVMADNGHKK